MKSTSKKRRSRRVGMTQKSETISSRGLWVVMERVLLKRISVVLQFGRKGKKGTTMQQELVQIRGRGYQIGQ